MPEDQDRACTEKKRYGIDKIKTSYLPACLDLHLRRKTQVKQMIIQSQSSSRPLLTGLTWQQVRRRRAWSFGRLRQSSQFTVTQTHYGYWYSEPNQNHSTDRVWISSIIEGKQQIASARRGDNAKSLANISLSETRYHWIDLEKLLVERARMMIRFLNN